MAVIDDREDLRGYRPMRGSACEMLEAQLGGREGADPRERSSGPGERAGDRGWSPADGDPGRRPAARQRVRRHRRRSHALQERAGLAAWIGLVPKQNSSGGKERLGSISKAGNRYLRQMLVVGAMAVIRYAERHGTRRPWLVQLLAGARRKVAAVALANKTARMVWALMTSGERYREPTVTLA